MREVTVGIIDGTSFKDEAKKYLMVYDDVRILFTLPTGKDAFTLCQRHRPEVIILDLVLPDLDGFQVLQDFNDLDYKPRIFVTSALTSNDAINAAVRFGADYFLQKPIDLEALYNRISYRITSLDKVYLNQGGPSAAEEEFIVEREKVRSTMTLEEKISSLFISVGMPPHIRGYQYLKEAIRLAIRTPMIVNNITKQLYPKIAEKFDSSASKVERAIRHAIECTWSKSTVVKINKALNTKLTVLAEKPTNSEFIALIADRLLLEGFKYQMGENDEIIPID